MTALDEISRASPNIISPCRAAPPMPEKVLLYSGFWVLAFIHFEAYLIILIPILFWWFRRPWPTIIFMMGSLYISRHILSSTTFPASYRQDECRSACRARPADGGVEYSHIFRLERMARSRLCSLFIDSHIQRDYIRTMIRDSPASAFPMPWLIYRLRKFKENGSEERHIYDAAWTLPHTLFTFCAPLFLQNEII